jgi:2-succinyl-6-hydroxy-2,4-cyclohexadiene-1-carboxylate synthase
VPGRLVLVHGFTQNAQCWAGIDDALAAGREVLAVDAAGHGSADAVRAGLWEAAELIGDAGGPADYLGYSMGGRLCLHLALAHPQTVRRLVLVSATAGIEDPEARADRRQADDRLASELEASGDVEAFVERWLASPLFANLPSDRSGREARAANTVSGLASSLRQCGTGNQEDLWPRLPELTMPVLVVAGEADEKYAGLARRMAAAIPAGQLALVEGAGHACHLEQPDRFVALVADFLR